MCGHSGDDPEIPLVLPNDPPTEPKQRWKVTEKMNLIPQYAMAGDYTGMVLTSTFCSLFDITIVEAIKQGVTDVAKYDAGAVVFQP